LGQEKMRVSQRKCCKIGLLRPDEFGKPAESERTLRFAIGMAFDGGAGENQG
jgi:hypothetical protein